MQQSPPPSVSGRALSGSKRAEQNRKAQRAFRERRDQHVKTLESRSQLLDAAIASADEANRRWEECRTLVEQLRMENAALRAELSQLQMVNDEDSGAGGPNHGASHMEVTSA
jgi:DNA repair exonuclease SbcCD ATPase subunit